MVGYVTFTHMQKYMRSVLTAKQKGANSHSLLLLFSFNAIRCHALTAHDDQAFATTSVIERSYSEFTTFFQRVAQLEPRYNNPTNLSDSNGEQGFLSTLLGP